MTEDIPEENLEYGSQQVKTEISITQPSEPIVASSEPSTAEPVVTPTSTQTQTSTITPTLTPTQPPPSTQIQTEPQTTSQVITAEATTPESQIFDNLQTLNVSIPADSPLVNPIPSPQNQSIFTASPTRVTSMGGDQDEEEEITLAPYVFVDQDADLDENELMSIKQYRILNRKINLIIKYVDDIVDKDIEKEEAFEKFSLEMSEKVDGVSKDVLELKTKFTEYQTQLTTLSTNVNEKLSSLDTKVVVSESSLVEDLKSQLLAAKEREDALRKQLDESLLHSQQLKENIPVFDAQKLANDYNENVVKHVTIVQQDFMAKLKPLLHLASRLPTGVAKPSSKPAQQGEKGMLNLQFRRPGSQQ